MKILEWDSEYPDEDYRDDPYDDVELDYDDKWELVDEWIKGLSKQQMVDIIDEHEKVSIEFEKYKKENGITDIEEFDHGDISQFITDIDIDELIDDYVDEDKVNSQLDDARQSAKDYDDMIADQNHYYNSTRGV